MGATLIMSLGNLRYKGLFVAGGILGYCVALLLLAGASVFAIAILATALLGFFDSTQGIPRTTIIQSITPDRLRGRVSSFQNMLTAGAPSVGQFTSGAVAAVLGPSMALVLGAVSCAALILGFVTARADLRDPEVGNLPEGGSADSTPVPARA